MEKNNNSTIMLNEGADMLQDRLIEQLKGDAFAQVDVFNFGDAQVRTVTKDGEAWFVAKDVCAVLGLEQTSRAMDRLEEDEVGYIKVTHP